MLLRRYCMPGKGTLYGTHLGGNRNSAFVAALFSAGLVRKFATLRHSETVPRKIITVIPKGVENPWWNQVRLGALAGVAGTPYRMV